MKLASLQSGVYTRPAGGFSRPLPTVAQRRRVAETPLAPKPFKRPSLHRAPSSIRLIRLIGPCRPFRPGSSFRSLPSASVKASQNEIFGVSPDSSLSHYMTIHQSQSVKPSQSENFEPTVQSLEGEPLTTNLEKHNVPVAVTLRGPRRPNGWDGALRHPPGRSRGGAARPETPHRQPSLPRRSAAKAGLPTVASAKVGQSQSR